MNGSGPDLAGLNIFTPTRDDAVDEVFTLWPEQRGIRRGTRFESRGSRVDFVLCKN